jgi:D-serine deaminase-like pyridoxal phosphate-dependent protein
MRVSDLDTPALLIDLDIMERNLGRVAAYARESDLRLRPHTKTHKIPALGRRQLDLGAAGLTVAKVGEAEVMLNANPGDLLVAYPVIGRRKLERLMAVARRASVTVALDNLTAARQLSDAARAAQIEVGCIGKDFRRAGLPLEVVSGGSTPTLFLSHRIAGMT